MTQAERIADDHDLACQRRSFGRDLDRLDGSGRDSQESQAGFRVGGDPPRDVPAPHRITGDDRRRRRRSTRPSRPTADGRLDSHGQHITIVIDHNTGGHPARIRGAIHGCILERDNRLAPGQSPRPRAVPAVPGSPARLNRRGIPWFPCSLSGAGVPLRARRQDVAPPHPRDQGPDSLASRDERPTRGDESRPGSRRLPRSWSTARCGDLQWDCQVSAGPDSQRDHQTESRTAEQPGGNSLQQGG